MDMSLSKLEKLDTKKVKSLNHVRLFATPWTVAYQAPLSVEFSRLEYWSGLPFPSRGDLPNPGIEPGLPHCRQMLCHLSHQGSSNLVTKQQQKKLLSLAIVVNFFMCRKF